MLSQPQSSEQSQLKTGLSRVKADLITNKKSKLNYKAHLRSNRILLSASLFVLSLGLSTVLLAGESRYAGKMEVLIRSQSDFGLTSLRKTDLENGSKLNFTEILSSEAILSTVVDILNSQYPEITFSELKRNLLISQASTSEKQSDISENVDSATDVIDIKYVDKDPQKVESVLKAIEQAYLQYNSEQTQLNLVKSLEFIDRRLSEVVLEAEKSGNELALLTKNHDFLGRIDSYRNELKNNQRNLEETLTKLQSALVQQQQDYNSLELKLNNDLAQANKEELNPSNNLLILRDGQSSNILVSNQDGETLLDQKIQSIDNQYKRILGSSDSILSKSEQSALPLMNPLFTMDTSGASVTPRAIESSQAFIFGDVTSQFIQQQIDVEININDHYAQILAIESEIQSVKNQLQQIPLIQEKYRNLSNQFEKWEQEYQTLLRQRRKIELNQVSDTLEINNPNVVEISSDYVGVFSPKFLFLLLLSSGLTCFAYRYFNSLDETINKLEQIEALCDQSLMGIIPKVKTTYTNSDIGRVKKFDYESNLTMLRAVRSLSLNINNSRKNNPSYILAITSSFPNEGKSTLIYNTANSLAQLGYKTVLVDADLRKPTLHRLSGLINGLGLTDALTYGYQNNLDELIYKTATPNLSIMTSGTLPPDPLPLLKGKNMQKLVTRLQDEYDYVLFDCPPMIVDSDISTIAQYCDGTMLVCRLGMTTHRAITSSLNRIRKFKKSSFLGVIANYYCPTSIKQHNADVSSTQYGLSTSNSSLKNQLSFMDHRTK